jgi:branched-chain amino acid transport system permease protein
LGVASIETIAFILSDIDALKPYWPVILGVIMLVVVVYRPTGIMGLLVSARERIGSFGHRGRADAVPDLATDPAKEDTHGAA